MQKPQTILITGVAGFIGQNLCEKLLNLNKNIIGIDNFLSSKKENIKKFTANKNFKFIEHDIRTPLNLKEKIDLIINLACPASPPWYQKYPIETWETSVFGVKNLVDLAISNKATLVHASTSEVYGDPLKSPQDEKYFGNVNPIGIRSCYDEGKRAAESYLTDIARLNKANIKIIRIFNTYGPYMDRNDGRVVSNFINQALEGKSLTVYGKGDQTRSFMYIDDLIDGILKMIEKIDFTGPINLGNPSEMKVIDLAKTIIQFTKSKSKIVFKPPPQDDPMQRLPDIALAKKQLNWQPQINLEKGLKKTIEYFINA